MPTDRRATCTLLGPRLLPGALLLRRDARTLQIGTSPGILIPDRPGLGRVLRLLDGSLPIRLLARIVARDIPEFTDDLDVTLNRLTAVGAVIALAPPPHRPSVAVRHDRSTAAFAALVTERLDPPAIEPDVEVLISAGEPARSAFETLATAGVIHLPVVLDERRVRIGPFVVPGTTPCLGCLDALLMSYDRTWAVLLPQFERPRLLPVGLRDHVLMRAAAEVLDQIEALANHERPSTVGRALSIGPGLADIDQIDVPFSPECSCGLLAA